MKAKRKLTGVIGVSAAVALSLAACSSSGGKAAEQSAQSQDAAAGGQADTARIKIAMVTHAVPGDTFWDQIRTGAMAAAKKDNVKLIYSADPDGGKQATLVQNAIDQHVDGIAVTLAHADAMSGAVKDAVDAGIPVVAFNSGLEDWQDMGIMSYFGQDEFIAGQAFGKKLNELGAKHVVCVNQEQGHVGLEARCGGLKKEFKGKSEVLYVKSADMPSVRQNITAKLQSESDIDYVATLGAPFAMTALQSVKDADSNAKVATFDLNDEVIKSIKDGDITFAVDQQPYLQGYEAVDSLWLYKYNGAIIGGGQAVLTGPTFVTNDNIGDLARFNK
ncbi:MAG TPA: sugar ABC transporter substrate-binding protein [Segeticoccus sp.]|nr:sugar ABC transporter substrate-binding protein [Segeticoccus sp.]